MSALDKWKEKATFQFDFGDDLIVTGVRVDLADLALRLTEGLEYLSKGVSIGTDGSNNVPEDENARREFMATVLENKRKFYFAILRRTLIAPRLTEEDWDILNRAISTDKLAEYLAEVTRTSDSSGIKSTVEQEGESQVSVGIEPSVSHTA